ncbi:tyrosyl-DNA phosphodiesterase-domain-containing protein [Vararia minispora EC-137]|uniref:Tyrosyl-DNA phosphodiesterase-domain-containing protein n=1 Tax=Vararia minispora EC-137 TaxID=1314806 RepID=A0ACB8QH03_9AGAM|nr:tyrosyl-DNA phosphodiesterase-domain-containing protein [Vararia minispora EC-137]
MTPAGAAFDRLRLGSSRIILNSRRTRRVQRVSIISPFFPAPTTASVHLATPPVPVVLSQLCDTGRRMSDSDQDEDLARAIALSLRESNRSSQPTAGGSKEQPEDDDARFQADLQRAITASQAVQPTRSPSPTTSITSSADTQQTPPLTELTESAPSGPSGSSSGAYNANTFLSERAQLEQARLARLKRFREQSGQTEPGERPLKRKTPSVSPDDRSLVQGKIAVGTPGLVLDGAVRQTANRHAYPGKNGEDGNLVWRLSEIIGDKSDVQLAILSSYAIQLSWIYEFFNPGTPVILVAQPATQESSGPTVKQVLPSWIRVTPVFRGGGYGVMHIKIFYKTGRLRIVIPTANLVPYDWRDIENSAFVQDLPRRASPIPHDPSADNFASTLENVLRVLNVEAGLRSHIHNDHPGIPLSSVKPGSLWCHWDFSRVTVRLIASLNGKYEGWPKVINVGHTALMKAVRDLAGITDRKGRKGSVDMSKGSSIGTYSSKWLNEFYGSCMGENPEVWLDQPKSRRDKLSFPDIKILFPTLRYVQESASGEQGGGTMFCRKNQWYGPRSPCELFHQSRSRRGKILMHSKMIITMFSDGAKTSASDSIDDDVILLDQNGNDPRSVIGWAYIGSHNFTPSAWGNLSGSAFSPVINISNYELGIVLPLYSEGDANNRACYERPPMKYLSDDRPWMQEESEYFKQ